MMSKTTKFIFILFAFLNYSQNSDLFDQGNDFYNQGRYFEAIEKYNLILKNGSHSDELYYNLGNSYYKLNDIANSIFYYEKALILSPNDGKILNNLSFANNMLIDKIDSLPKNQISSFFNSLINLFNYSTWQYIYLFFEYVAVIFLLLYFDFFTYPLCSIIFSNSGAIFFSIEDRISFGNSVLNLPNSFSIIRLKASIKSLSLIFIFNDFW